MAVFFGTDGIRGVVNDFLTHNLAFKCGNSLAYDKESPTIIIGCDTRPTASFLISAFAGGAMSAGANVIDIGVCPTAGIAYITRELNADYGVVISASHNPSEYNGIKIFDDKGFKLGDKNEEALERRFVNEKNVDYLNVGKYIQRRSLTKKYENYLVSCCKADLSGLKIVLDCSNGASCKVAPRVFKRLGAKVISTHARVVGNKINYKCGSTYPETLCRAVKRYKADVGFAFDGDADRIVACDEKGNIIDGDNILFMLAKYLKTKNELKNDTVVGTSHTNIGIEKELNNYNINLIRTDIGDKYVISKIEESGLSLGGEKSGHVIIRQFSTTGDGILTGVKIAEMLKALDKKPSMLVCKMLYPQINIDCVVYDKLKVINSEKVNKEIKIQQAKLGKDARIMVRCSGTESKIRIMVECKNKSLAERSAKYIEEVVYEVDKLT